MTKINEWMNAFAGWFYKHTGWMNTFAAWVFKYSSKFGLYIGLTLTVLVSGLIIYGNFFATSVTPVGFRWASQPDLHICDTAPAWARPGQPSFDKAVGFWKDHGWTFASVSVGPCSESCTGTDKAGNARTVACVKGAVTLDLMDQWMGVDHVGRCTFSGEMLAAGVVTASDWTTITVPPVVLEAEEFATPEGETQGRSLPADAEGVVLAHEIGHCLVGLEHNLGPALGCDAVRLNAKTGHVMNPSIYTSGWVDETLPTTPSWK